MKWLSIITSINHRYIIGHNNPSVRIMDLVSQTTYVVYVGSLHFNVDSEQQIYLKNFSWQIHLVSEFLPEICWEEIADEIFFHISFWCLTWDTNLGFTSNKPIHYLLDHGDLENHVNQGFHWVELIKKEMIVNHNINQSYVHNWP